MINRLPLLIVAVLLICLQGHNGAEARTLDLLKNSESCSLVREKLLENIERLQKSYEVCWGKSFDRLLRRKRAPELIWDIE
nr:neuropeptide [Hymenolepis microstoma]